MYFMNMINTDKIFINFEKFKNTNYILNML